MKKILTFCAVALLSVSAYAATFADMSVDDVNKAVAAKSAVIIDVNGDESYQDGHVPGALNYFAIKKNLAANLPADKSTLIIAYCRDPECTAYQQAAKGAQKLGYKNIKHMPAGIDGWKAAGMKTEPGA